MYFPATLKQAGLRISVSQMWKRQPRNMWFLSYFRRMRVTVAR